MILRLLLPSAIGFAWAISFGSVTTLGDDPRPPLGTRPQLRLVTRSSDSPSRDRHIIFRNVALPDGPYTVCDANNPVIRGRNLYAPKFVRVGNRWNCYFGGWQDDGQVHDKIYLKASPDIARTLDWSSPRVVIENGSYEHVNDPTVVIDGKKFHMLYTAARGHNDSKFGEYFRDWINYSTSTDGVHWAPAAGDSSTEITLRDPQNLAGGAITSIARPSLVQTESGWLMWFDANAQGQPAAGLHCYLARSSEKPPTSFDIIHRYPDIEGSPGFFEPDVVLRPDGTYLAVVQRHFGQLFLATSSNGMQFDFHGPSLAAANPHFERERVSNPALLYDQTTGINHGVAFGMASVHLTDHDIGFAYSQYIIQLRSPAITPGGQPVWHVYARSNGSDEQLVNIFEYRKFDSVRIIDRRTNSTVLEQPFDEAQPGDVWELIPAGFQRTAP